MNEIDNGVAAVVSGSGSISVAEHGLDPEGLNAAMKAYRAVLADRRDGRTWRQFAVECNDRNGVTTASVDVVHPLMVNATNGLIVDWWFMRKHPGLRVRVRTTALAAMHQYMAETLDRAVALGRIRSWTTGVYEPEIHAFGGADALGIAHDLFVNDSKHVLNAVIDPLPIGAVELAVLRVGQLMRAAGLDWYEQGDVWRRLAAHRPVQSTVRPVTPRQRADLYRLLATDAGPDSRLIAMALSRTRDWITAFDTAGQRLAILDSNAGLTRGIRSVITHHVLFAFNRAGLSAETQSILVAAAGGIIFDEDSPYTLQQ